MEYTHKTRTNAAIGYFFLGFLFLLAKRNPNFAEPFVRQHAKSATKLQLLLVAYVVLHEMVLSRFLDLIIPFVSIRLDRVLLIAVFGYVFGMLFVGALRAFAGKEPAGLLVPEIGADLGDLSALEIRNESEFVRSVLSFVPFVSLFAYERFRTPLTAIGVRVSGAASLLFILLFAFSNGESLMLALLFLYVVLLVTVSMLLYLGKSVEFLSAFASIPSLDSVALYIRTIPAYLKDVMLAAAGKKDDLDLRARLLQRKELDGRSEEELAKYFNGSPGPFSPYIIYVPVLNLLYIVRFFSRGKTPYVVAIGQGIVLTILVALVGYFRSPWDPILALALFPMALGMATVKTRPFYRIPVLYELSALLSFLTFGLVSGTKSMHEKSKEAKQVSYKV